MQKKPLKALLFVDFSKAFDSIHRGKMGQILLSYSLTKRTYPAKMILLKKIQEFAHRMETDFFEIVAGVLLGSALAPCLFIICQVYVFWKSIDLMKKMALLCRRQEAETITDVNLADNIALQANTPVEAKSQLYNQERTAGDIGFHVNTHKIEFMRFFQRCNIFTQNRRYLKLVDK